MSARVIEVEDLVFDYGKGKNRFRALKGISFAVEQGETVGFIGANGAGKTTTIKTLMGFQFPTSGIVKVFGETAGTVASKSKIGYLPEVALYYPFMKARELLELYGGLQGLSQLELKMTIPEVLEKIGLGGKGETLLRDFSKGMQQRLGIAQAIIAYPQALILDEISSGLDPVGRHDLREVLRVLQSRGKTIFFSSHELTEVESLCDRVIVIDQGEIVAANPIEEMRRPLDKYEITFLRSPGWSSDTLPESFGEPSAIGDQLRLEVEGTELYGEAMRRLTNSGAEIVSTESRHQNLEDYYMGLIRDRHSASEVAE